MEFPPFGFTVWYDRYQRCFRWRERRRSGNPDDATEGTAFASRREAIQSVRTELRRRGARDTPAADADDADLAEALHLIQGRRAALGLAPLDPSSLGGDEQIIAYAESLKTAPGPRRAEQPTAGVRRVGGEGGDDGHSG